MNVTPLRPVRLAGLLLVALCVLSSTAAAKGPELAYRASPPAAVGTSSLSVSDVQCPCNAGLPRASVVNASSPAECPCNAGLPDGPSGALSARVTSETIVPASAGGISSSSVSDAQCPCNAGLPVRQAASVSSPQCPCNLAGGPPGGLSELLRTTGGDAAHSASAARQVSVVHAPANQPRGTFDWAAASVGAGVTAGIGLLVAGGALLFGRHRVRGQLRAS